MPLRRECGSLSTPLSLTPRLSVAVRNAGVIGIAPAKCTEVRAMPIRPADPGWDLSVTSDDDGVGGD